MGGHEEMSNKKKYILIGIASVIVGSLVMALGGSWIRQAVAGFIVGAVMNWALSPAEETK